MTQVLIYVEICGERMQIYQKTSTFWIYLFKELQKIMVSHFENNVQNIDEFYSLSLKSINFTFLVSSIIILITFCIWYKRPFIWIKFTSLYSRMLSAMFGWNLWSDSGEWNKYQIYKHPTDKLHLNTKVQLVHLNKMPWADNIRQIHV